MAYKNLMSNYRLPLFALFGLSLGLLSWFILQNPAISHWIWFATLIIGGIPIIAKTIQGMFKGQFASDIVAMLAILVAALMGQALAGAIVVLMQSGGEALETYGMRQASSSLQQLLSRAPRNALRKKGDQLEEIEVSQVQIGDLLVVRQGDLIPVDGTIIHGSAEIDESALTGEPLARTKTVNDPVFSGTIDVNGTIEMRADKQSKESQYQKIVELVQNAQLQKAPIERLADHYAIYFTPLTLLMSALGYWISGDSTTILSVLVVATPCPLILATPLAILCGINKAARNGIIVKGGAPMEQIGASKLVAFDKTGTITYGVPYVEEIVPLTSITPEELLIIAAALEQLSSHSIAKAVVEKAKGKTLPLPTHFKETPGCGVEGEIQSDHYRLGSHTFLAQTLGNEALQQVAIQCQPYYAREKLLIFIAKNKTCIGFLTISDRIRPHIPQLIDSLHSLGVEEVLLLTGDSAKNGEVIAKQAGIKNVRAELLPQQKVEIIREMGKKYHPLTMVGDGINDAPALATATVGVAMGALGSAISTEAASIVLLVDDVTKVADAIAISQRTLSIAKQSIFIGMGLSFALMVIAIFGLIEPAIGALLQELVDVAVILNALRAR